MECTLCSAQSEDPCSRGNRKFSSEKKKDMLNAAIEQYRKIPCVDENSDPLLF
jgi:hypothetical protein